MGLSSFVIIKTIFNIFFIFFFLKLLFCCVSHRVAFTQEESFKNYSPQSGTVILKLFGIRYGDWVQYLTNRMNLWKKISKTIQIFCFLRVFPLGRSFNSSRFGL